MSVGSWDPDEGDLGATIDDALLSELIAAEEALESDDLGLEPDGSAMACAVDVHGFRPLAAGISIRPVAL